MTTLIFIILQLIIFYLIKYFIYQLTDVKGLPSFLNYKPYNCYKCFSFWLNISISILFTIYVNIIGLFGIGLTILDTIAFIIYEKNNFYSIKDVKDEELERK